MRHNRGMQTLECLFSRSVAVGTCHWISPPLHTVSTNKQDNKSVVKFNLCKQNIGCICPSKTTMTQITAVLMTAQGNMIYRPTRTCMAALEQLEIVSVSHPLHNTVIWNDRKNKVRIPAMKTLDSSGFHKHLSCIELPQLLRTNLLPFPDTTF